MTDHAEADYPHECCGGLLGIIDGDSKIVMAVIPIENNWEDSGDETKTRRFRITADDYQSLEKKAKDCKQTLLGFYHSHPDHPPIPSETDLKFAWPFFSYPILSIQNGRYESIQSYQLVGDKFEEEGIRIQ